MIKTAASERAWLQVQGFGMGLGVSRFMRSRGKKALKASFGCHCSVFTMREMGLRMNNMP